MKASQVLVACTTLAVHARAASIPDFVIDYAPLVYIDVNDPYLPSDIGAQITNTYPELNFTRISSAPSDLSLDNLSQLNSAGDCSSSDFDACSVYLTARTNASANPPWLYGILPDPTTGETVGARSCAVVVNDHGNEVVDAFYFYFYAFNQGENFTGTILGDHVGDWEHTMVRFMSGKPDTIWYSAHDGGFVYTYDAVSKRNDTRPLVYASLGGHANYATPGLQERHIGNGILNDTTSPGPLWDPVRSAYFYTYTANSSSPYNATFIPVADPTTTGSSSDLPPVDWLYFLGRWGDKQYPDSNPVQINVANITWAWVDGPTGPLDKQLQRNGTCPKDPCTTTSSLPGLIGTTSPVQTILRTEAPVPPTTSSGGGQGSGTTTSGGTGSPTSTSSSAASTSSRGSVSIWLVAVCGWILYV